MLVLLLLLIHQVQEMGKREHLRWKDQKYEYEKPEVCVFFFVNYQVALRVGNSLVFGCSLLSNGGEREIQHSLGQSFWLLFWVLFWGDPRSMNEYWGLLSREKIVTECCWKLNFHLELNNWKFTFHLVLIISTEYAHIHCQTIEENLPHTVQSVFRVITV